MNEPKHTPGPWKWETFEDPALLPQLLSPDGLICDFGNREPYYPVEGTPPNEANARLIAAAPELLEALKALVSNIEESNWGIKSPAEYETEALISARAAIAKAEGAKS